MKSGLYFNLVKIMFSLLIVAAVLNGASFWLKRVGYIEPQLYEYYRNTFDVIPGYKWTPAEDAAVKAFTAKLYSVSGVSALGKRIKDLWLVLFVVCSVTIIFRHRLNVFRHASLPLYLFTGVAAFGFLHALIEFTPLMALAGGRFFAFLGIAWTGFWAVRSIEMHFLARGLLYLMAVQFVLLPIELNRGLRLFGARFFGADFGDRVVGTFLQPSSLGISMVLFLTICLTYSTERRWRVLLAMMTTITVFYTASAIAWLLLLMLGLGMLYQRLSSNQQHLFRMAAYLTMAALFLLLPDVTGRIHLMDSLWGRLFVLSEYLDHAPLISILLGNGVGVATNAAASLFLDLSVTQQTAGAARSVFVADSMLLALIAQIGLVGMALFYLLLYQAAKRDHQATLFYSLIATASLTTNIVELFPVNVLLGLMLCRSLFVAHEETQ